MKSKTITSSLFVCLLALVVSGCGDARPWPQDGPPEGVTAKRIVLFAPVDAGGVQRVYPDASLAWARDMARKIDVLVEDASAFVGEALPLSSDPVWNQGPVGAARGAHLVVLTEVLELESDSSTTADAEVRAKVLMRALGHDGEEKWRKELTGTAPLQSPAKIMADSGKPEAKAAWEGIKQDLSALRFYLEQLPTVGPIDRPSDELPPEEAVLVDVVVDSIPPNADILIDGTFLGNTPVTVPLPVREITVRIERQGYQPWERTLTPSSDMRIQPALEPLDTAAE